MILQQLIDNLSRQIANYNDMLVMAGRVCDPHERILALDLIIEEMGRTQVAIERAKEVTKNTTI